MLSGGVTRWSWRGGGAALLCVSPTVAPVAALFAGSSGPHLKEFVDAQTKEADSKTFTCEEFVYELAHHHPNAQKTKLHHGITKAKRKKQAAKFHRQKSMHNLDADEAIKGASRKRAAQQAGTFLGQRRTMEALKKVCSLVVIWLLARGRNARVIPR